MLNYERKGEEMKKFLAVIVFLGMSLFLPIMLMAQVVQDPSQVISTTDSLQQIMALFSGGHLKGLALVGVVIQVLMLLLRTDFVVNKIGQAKAGLRLAIILALSWLGGISALMLGGMTFGAALLHATSLAAFQVLAHQIYSNYIETKAPKA